MMRGKTSKLKKGGLDTIIAYIVVMIPLLYVLVYMVATIYHFSVQTYMNQVVKEAAVMASTYGQITSAHTGYIHSKLKGILGKDENENAKCEIKYYIRKFNPETGTVAGLQPLDPTQGVEKADIIGIQVISTDESLLGSVTSFGIFGGDNGYTDDKLRYTSYREEIIRNDRDYNP